MPIEFIGMIGTKLGSETIRTEGPVIDPGYTKRFARAHEDAGFDRILIGYGSGYPEGSQVAAYAAAHTERISLLIAHRPGFVAPTLAARQFATLDQFSGGRVAVHTITGGNNTEQRRDGDYLEHDERYARTDEYLSILRKTWESEEPFSHEGTYYRFEDHYAETKPAHRIPVSVGGSSEDAYRVGGQQGDIFGLWGEPLKETSEQIAAVHAAARAAGRAELPAHLGLLPPDRRRDRRTRLGAGRGHPGRHHRRLRVLLHQAQGLGRSPASSRRTPARSGCSRRPRGRTGTTARCGRPPRRPPGPAATRPRWSARRRRSRRRCSTTWISA